MFEQNMCSLLFLQDPVLLCHPLVSPTRMSDLTGLSGQGMLVVAGGAELMRPDIAAFAGKAKAAGEAYVHTVCGCRINYSLNSAFDETACCPMQSGRGGLTSLRQAKQRQQVFIES
jgi:acetyl esterase/lipase